MSRVTYRTYAWKDRKNLFCMLIYIAVHVDFVSLFLHSSSTTAQYITSICEYCHRVDASVSTFTSSQAQTTAVSGRFMPDSLPRIREKNTSMRLVGSDVLPILSGNVRRIKNEFLTSQSVHGHIGATLIFIKHV